MNKTAKSKRGGQAVAGTFAQEQKAAITRVLRAGDAGRAHKQSDWEICRAILEAVRDKKGGGKAVASKTMLCVLPGGIIKLVENGVTVEESKLEPATWKLVQAKSKRLGIEPVMYVHGLIERGSKNLKAVAA